MQRGSFASCSWISLKQSNKMFSKNLNTSSLKKDLILIESLRDETLSFYLSENSLSSILFILNMAMFMIALIGKSMIIRFILKYTSNRLINIMILKDQVSYVKQINFKKKPTLSMLWILSTWWTKKYASAPVVFWIHDIDVVICTRMSFIERKPCASPKIWKT